MTEEQAPPAPEPEAPVTETDIPLPETAGQPPQPPTGDEADYKRIFDESVNKSRTHHETE